MCDASGLSRREHHMALNVHSDGNTVTVTLRDNLKGEDGTAIKRAMDNLTQVSHKMAEEMYKAGGTPEGGAPEAQSDRGTTGEQPKKDDDVIDAEYEVKS